MTTEHEAKRQPAHFLTETICDMLAYDGKPYTLSVEQQMAWDGRFAKLCERHGDEKVIDLLGEFFESGRLQKSTRPMAFAEFVADATHDRWGHNPSASPSWEQAMARCRQHAYYASKDGWPDEYRWNIMGQCYRDLTNAAIHPGADDDQRDRLMESAKTKASAAMREIWTREECTAWATWREGITAEIANRTDWRKMKTGDAA